MVVVDELWCEILGELEMIELLIISLRVSWDLLSTIGVTIFWMDVIEVEVGGVVEGFGGVDLGRVDDGVIREGI